MIFRILLIMYCFGTWHLALDNITLCQYTLIGLEIWTNDEFKDFKLSK